MFLWLCVLCAVVCQRRSYSTFLTLTVWLLTAQDLLLLDSGEEEVLEEEQSVVLVVTSAFQNMGLNRLRGDRFFCEL